MDWMESELSKLMFVDEKLIWGLKTKVLTSRMERRDCGWWDESVFFTDRRILILWDVEKGNLFQIPYEAISRLGVDGNPGSGGPAGVKCMFKKGGVVDIGSTYGNVSIQFPDAESFKYGQWLLNEAAKGSRLAPSSDSPLIAGKIDPNEIPQPPRPKEKATSGFFSKMKQEISKGAAVASIKSKEAMEVLKIQGQIKSVQQQKNNELHELGKVVYSMFLNNNFDENLIKERGTDIQSKDARLKELEDEIVQVKNKAQESLLEQKNTKGT